VIILANFVVGILSLTIGAIVLSSVLITTLKSANQSGWGTGEIALWGTISLVSIAGMVYGAMAVFGMA
jgi:hypothetical protein